MRYLLLLALFLLAHTVQAKPATIPLSHMVQQSPVIGVCRVESVKTIHGLRFAQVIVLRPLKGCKEGQQFTYLAESTWTCDTTTAISSETALLFLHPLKENPFGDYLKKNKKRRKQFATAKQNEFRGMPLYHVVHSGNGRMPILFWRGQQYINRSPCVTFPASKVTYIRDKADPDMRRPYSLLESTIADILKTPVIRTPREPRRLR